MTGSSPQNKQMYHPIFVSAAWRCFPAKVAVLKSFTWYSQSNFSQATLVCEETRSERIQLNPKKNKCLV